MRNQELRFRGLRLLCIALLMLGILFRLINLDKKFYWHDEVYTSLEVTAHSRSELVKEIFTGREVIGAELQKYQHIDPTRGLGQAIDLLGQQDAQHPPLYLALLRVWLEYFGESVTITRSLSAVISLFVFPCVYWLCWELFGSSLIGWMAIALLAISPFHVLYAQEAREYSLWTVATLLCSAALLRAIRLKTWSGWAFYSATLIFSFYTHLFSGLVAIWQGIYVLLSNDVYTLSITGFRLGKTAIAYVISSLIAVITFIPWIYYILTYSKNVQSGTAWAAISPPPLILVQEWATSLSQIFLDFNLDGNQPLTYCIIFPVLILEIYAVYVLCREVPRRSWLFVLTLMASTSLSLLLPDLILGGQRSIVERYMIPAYLGVEIAVAYLLTHWISSARFARHRFWQVVTVALVWVGIMSCAVSSQAETWWNKGKGVSYFNPQMAHVINQAKRPVLITDSYGINPGNVVSLSYLLNEKVKFLLIPEVGISLTKPKISPEFSDVFLLNMPEIFFNQYRGENGSRVIPVVDTLWKLER